MKTLVLLGLLLGAVACGGSQTAPATAASANSSSNGDDSEPRGATNAQGSDNPNRAMNQSECEQLGEYISGVCHETHTRQARIDGWCSDIVSKISGGAWASECTAKLKYMDSVCFRSTDNAPAMMVCDRTSTE
jgi:hypothetical protein